MNQTDHAGICSKLRDSLSEKIAALEPVGETLNLLGSRPRNPGPKVSQHLGDVELPPVDNQPHVPDYLR